MSQQLHLPVFPPVKLEMSFEDLLGNKCSNMPSYVRRERWGEWKRIAGLRKKSRDCLAAWTDTEGCDGCVHLDGDWCAMQQLPCTVNPILSFREGLIGMACMGAGYKAAEAVRS